MNSYPTYLAFDADDTLWQNEIFYRQAYEKIIQLLAHYAPSDIIRAEVSKTEIANIPVYG